MPRRRPDARRLPAKPKKRISQVSGRLASRRLSHETLERRELLAAHFGHHADPILAPGSDPGLLDTFGSHGRNPGDGSAISLLGARWERTAVDTSPNIGDDVTITWSIVPDGTQWSNRTGNSPSDLVAFMDGIYGGAAIPVIADKPWFTFYEQIFDEWAERTGLTFQYVLDDGLAQSNAAIGELGLRGDMRIGGAPVDGDSNVLGFNFPPFGAGFRGLDGDTTIDTSDNFYSNDAAQAVNPNRGFLNVLSHEVGHGLGLGHVHPINQTKLMEPFVSRAFLGPQIDDILAIHALYGDRFGDNDLQTTPTPLPDFADTEVTLVDLSIDNGNDVDWFSFEANENTIVNFTIQPNGAAYRIGPQPAPGDPDDLFDFDSRVLSDLRFEIYNPDGSRLIAVNDGVLGESESITDLRLRQNGTYTVVILGDPIDIPNDRFIDERTNTQLYEMTFSSVVVEGPTGNPNPPVPPPPTVVRDSSGPTLIGVGPHERQLLELDIDDAPTILRESPTELTLSFDGRFRLNLPSANLENVYVQFSETSTINEFGNRVGVFSDPPFDDPAYDPAADPSIVPIGYRELGRNANQLILRFADTLRDGYYRVVVRDGLVADNTITPNVESSPFRSNVAGQTFQQIDFELELGARVIAVVPTPVNVVSNSVTGTVSITPLADVIDVYFDSEDLFGGASGVGTPEFYQLFSTGGTVEISDDVRLGVPASVSVMAAERKVRLTFADSIATLAGAKTAENIRLRIGDRFNPLTVALNPAAPGDLGTVSARTVFEAKNQSISGLGRSIDSPGASTDAGHRDVAAATHLGGLAADADQAIPTFYYSFSKGRKYGTSLGSSTPNLDNEMTAEMEQRFREAFEILGASFGLDMIEVPGTTIPNDPRALSGAPLIVVVGDMFPVAGINAQGDGTLATFDPMQGLLVFDSNESWYEGFGDAPDDRSSIFEASLRYFMIALGLGSPGDLPQGSYLGFTPRVDATGAVEWVFPGNADVLHGTHVFQTEALDVDRYEFELATAGYVNAEIVSQRLANASTLDASMAIFENIADPSDPDVWRLVAVNDDYFGADPFINLALGTGRYMLTVASEGNRFDPNSAAPGTGGASEGEYDLRLDFRPQDTAATAMFDADGTQFDGDRDGVAGGNYNFWFNVADAVNTKYVHKNFRGAGANGGLTTPYNNVQTALGAVTEGQVLRILGDAGFDNDLANPVDSIPYLIGATGAALADGRTFKVPTGVHVQIDAGAVFKMAGSSIQVGSDETENRLDGTLQVLGTPDIPVIFTSYNDRSVGTISNPVATALRSGDWGGLQFRADVDRATGRTDAEREGVFVNYVNHADIRFGGGLVDGRTVRPVDLSAQRPEVSFNTITRSASAAISADAQSFEFTTFTENRYQSLGAFVPDFQRIGPDFVGNSLSRNSRNGVFVEIETLPGNRIERLTVPARFNDADIVHVFAENLILDDSPGGPFVEFDPAGVDRGTRPDSAPVLLQPRLNSAANPGDLPAGAYRYIYTFVDASGNESLPSQPRTVNLSGVGSVRLTNLGLIDAANPQSSFTADFVGRRIYRASATGDFVFVGEVDQAITTFVDNDVDSARGTRTISATDPRLADGASFRRSSSTASLVIDPGLIIKSAASRIELGMGTTLIAEGRLGRDIVFTSVADDRFGAGGTFDSNNNATILGGDRDGERGDWGGLYAGVLSRLSVDRAVIANAGGVTGLAGTTGGFNAIEIHQADARIANTHFEKIADGQGGATTPVREGRGPNDTAVIYAVASQPVIVNNTFDGVNDTDPVASNGSAAVLAAISINADSLTTEYVTDFGRQSGVADVFQGSVGNQGPLVRGNRIQDLFINAMVVREQTLTTESVWDDTDIVHVLQGEIVVPNFHSVGGLRLASRGDESLVVKLQGATAGFTASGLPIDIQDRIGGRLHVIGQPGFPVILTSIGDATVGAGFDIDGRPNRTTIGGSGGRLPIGPEVDRGPRIDNDVPDDIAGHFEFLPRAGGDRDISDPNTDDAVTTQGRTQPFLLQTSLFAYLNYVDVGADGGAFELGSTNITLQPTLIADDVVVSEGNFDGENGVINWRVEQSFEDGSPVLVTRVQFASADPTLAIGDLRFINYYDPVIASDGGDILFTEGTPGTNNYRVTVLDGPERVGFRHYGTFEEGAGLENGTYEGWAADNWPEHAPAFPFPFTINGTIDLVDIPQIDIPDLPLPNYGPAITTTAHAWLANPSATGVAFTANLELLESPGALSGAGDWRGVRLNEFSHDRNVETVTEIEGNISGFGDSNHVPSINPQVLGLLATDEKSSDENLRLGFTIHGAISIPRDIDVYEFSAIPGTEVWLDIDRTEFGLDSVLELVDVNGNILAISDNSLEESLDPMVAMANMGIGRPMQFDPEGRTNADGSPHDSGSSNESDAGMRLVLPGQGTRPLRFFVRVRSFHSGDLMNTALVSAGQTSGSYQLQIRLREADEFGGSTIRHADLRFATNAIELIGLPAHSPLAGTATAIGTNTTFIGDLGSSDRGALFAAGDIDGDQDRFTFNVNRQDITGTDASGTGVDEAPEAVAFAADRISATFDVDYGEANTTLYLFNGDTLIAIGTDSNIIDDLAIDVAPVNIADLSRGSVGVNDPWIGPIELDAEGNYSIVVSANDDISAALQQFIQATPANDQIRLVRLEPIESQDRITEQRFSITNAELPSNFGPRGNQLPARVLDPLTFGTGPENVHQWTLGDLSLIVADGAELKVFNPFTGRHDSTINRSRAGAGTVLDDTAVWQNLGAFAGNPIGEMVGIDGRPQLANHAVTFFNPDGSINRTGSPAIEDLWVAAGDSSNPGPPTGLSFTAATYWNNENGTVPEAFDRRIYSVANRGAFSGQVTMAIDTDTPPNGVDDQVGIGGVAVPAQQRSNMIFLMSEQDGSIISRFNGLNRDGMPDDFESGQPFNVFDEDVMGENFDLRTSVPEFTPWSGTTQIGQVAVATAGSVTSVVAKGDFLYAFTDLGETFRYEIQNNHLSPVDNFGDLSIDDDVDNSRTTPDGLMRIGLGAAATTGVRVVDSDDNTLIFDHVAEAPIGFTIPGQPEGAKIFFGTVLRVENQGTPTPFDDEFFYDLHAFNVDQLDAGLDSRALRIFLGATRTQTFASRNDATASVQGLYFSPLTQNLWHLSNTVADEPGHGISKLDGSADPTATDGIRNQRNGGGTLFFGFDPLDNDFNQRENGPVYPAGQVPADDLSGFDNGTQFPGGAHGTMESRPIDLSAITAGDQPMMYFNYRLSTESAQGNTEGADTEDMRDSLRVFVAGDDNQWRLVATNNTGTDASGGQGAQEFDADVSGYFDPFLQNYVQELFDDGDNFRQARIDLGPFAGNKNVRVRFEYSSHGETKPDQSELQAVAGIDIPDGHVVGVGRGSTTDFQQLEFDHGMILNLPDGENITPGDTIDVDGTLITFASGTSGVGIIDIDGKSAAEIATDVAGQLAAFGAVTLGGVGNANLVFVELGVNVTVTGLPATVVQSTPGVAAGNIPIDVTPFMTAVEVRDAMRLALSNSPNLVDITSSPADRLAAFPAIGFAGIRVFGFVGQVGDSVITAVNGESYADTPGSTRLPGREFGIYRDGGTAFSGLGSRDNGPSFLDADPAAVRPSGVHIDDIIIGLAERGEVVSGAIGLSAFVDNPQNLPTTNPDNPRFGIAGIGTGNPNAIGVSGDYQLEVRTSRNLVDAGDNADGDNPAKLPAGYFTMNERLTRAASIEVVSSGAQINDGDTFTLSNGVETLTFEYNNVTDAATASPTDPANIEVGFTNEMTPADVAAAMIAAINQPIVGSVLGVRATTSNGLTVDPSDNVIALHGRVAADLFGGTDYDGADNHLNAIVHGLDVVAGPDNADSNRVSDQGQILIQQNTIFSSAGFAISGAPAIDDNGLVSPGPVRNLPIDNTSRQVPGVVIRNNLLVQNFGGGIRLDGGGNDPSRQAPFARIVNNTIHGNTSGAGLGIGIDIIGGASPTLSNNVISNTVTPVRLNNAGQVEVFATLLQDNANNALPIGVTDPYVAIVNTSTAPVSANQRNQFRELVTSGGPYSSNFYPQTWADSLLIDSSFKTVGERTELDNVKAIVGIAPSPIIAPGIDLVGQPRVDDQRVNPNIGGQGSSIFEDRGALDSGDVAGPIARLLNPLDNDPDSLDNDSLTGTVFRGTHVNRAGSASNPTDSLLNEFIIQLTDPIGIGPDQRTVTAEQVLVTENGRPLLAGADYVFGYSISSRQIRLTPTAGLWNPDAVYEIILLNEDHIAIDTDARNAPGLDGTGSDIADGDTVVLTGDEQVTFEFDAGYVLQLGQPLAIALAEGVNAAGVRFGDTITLTKPSPVDLAFDVIVTLEFVAAGGTAGGGNRAVEVAPGDDVAAVLSAINDVLRDPSQTVDVDDGMGVITTLTIAEAFQINPFVLDADPLSTGGNGLPQLVLNAFTDQRIEFGSANNVFSELGSTSSVADGQIFAYRSIGGTSGYEVRFQIQTFNDIDQVSDALTAPVFLDNPATMMLSVVNSAAFNAGDFLRIGDEIVAVVDRPDAVTLEVRRAMLGSVVQSHSIGETVTRLDRAGRSLLSANVTASGTMLVAMNGPALDIDTTDAAPDYLRIDGEIVEVLSLTGNDLVVRRGALGTTPSAHAANALMTKVTARGEAFFNLQTGSPGNDSAGNPIDYVGPDFQPWDRVLELQRNDFVFRPAVGDLIQLNDELVRVLDVQITEPADITIPPNWLVTLDRGLYGTNIATHGADTIAYIVDADVQPIALFASDRLDTELIQSAIGSGVDQVRLGMTDKIARALRSFGDPATDTDLRLPRAQGIENGRVYLGGQAGDELTLRSGSLTGLGALIDSEPGVTGNLSILLPPTLDIPALDTQNFRVTTGAGTALFEFSQDANVAAGSTIVRINGITDVQTLATRMATAITNAGLGLSPTLSGTDPIVLNLNGSFDVEFDRLTSGLAFDGIAGGSVAIPFIPSFGFSPEAVTTTMLDAIVNTPAVGLTGFTLGGPRLYLRSTDGSLPVANIEFETFGRFQTRTRPVDGIKDLAGNSLQANRPVDQTRFTILFGDQELDYGDAQSVRTPGVAPQTISGGPGGNQDAARHVLLVGVGFESSPQLGRVVDGEANGQPNTGATGDDRRALSNLAAALPVGQSIVTLTSTTPFIGFENASMRIGNEIVRFVRILDATSIVVLRAQSGTIAEPHATGSLIGVINDEDGLTFDPVRGVLNAARSQSEAIELTFTVTNYGVLDAWMDWNRDGDFNDPHEQIFGQRAVWPGANILPLVVPTAAMLGFDPTTAFGPMVPLRVRVSQNGGLLADQLAVGGEVEDHMLELIAGTPPDLSDLSGTTFVNNSISFATPEDTTLNAAIFSGLQTDADGDAITVLQVIDSLTGRVVSTITSTGGDTVTLLDSAGQLAGRLDVELDGAFTFVPEPDYSSTPIPGPDGILGTADDILPTLSFQFRLLDDTLVSAVEIGTVSLTVTPVNDLPTIDVVPGTTPELNIDEDASEQIIGLTGLTAGAGEIQPILVTVATQNTNDDGSVYLDLLSVDITHDGASSTGSLRFTPRADQYGTADIVITVTDGGLNGILGDADDGVVVQTINITVNPVNDKPTTVERFFNGREVAESTGDPALVFTFDKTELLAQDEDFVLGGGSGVFPFDEFNQVDADAPGLPAVVDDTSPMRVIQFRLENAALIQTAADPVGTMGLIVDFSVADAFTVTTTTGVFELAGTGGEFLSGTFSPFENRNNSSAFDPNIQELMYVIEDNGQSVLPMLDPANPGQRQVVTGTIENSLPVVLPGDPVPFVSNMTFTVTPTNDAPFIPTLQTIDTPEIDPGSTAEIDGVTFSAIDVFGDALATMLPGPTDATDENDGDSRGGPQMLGGVVIDVLNIPGQTVALGPYGSHSLFSAAPQLTIDGDLVIFPTANAFGIAVFTVTVTDNGQSFDPVSGTFIDDFRSTTATLTINVTPVNDAPVSFDRALEVAEVEEFANGTGAATGNVAELPLSPADFLGGTAANPALSEQSDFTDDIDFDASTGGVEFDEEEQQLRVVQFTVVDRNGVTQVIDASRSGEVILLITGEIEFTFGGDGDPAAFSGGAYRPLPNYNELAPFAANEQFTYVIEDFDVTRIPGSDFVSTTVPPTFQESDYTTVAGAASNNRSQPRTMTLTTRATNDAPDFPAFVTATFPEDLNDAGDTFNTVFYDVYGSQVITSSNPLIHGLPRRVFAGPATALDERAGTGTVAPVQTLTHTVTAVSVPNGMFQSTPMFDAFGVLTLTPRADVFGVAVFDVTTTDNGQTYNFASQSLVTSPRSVTRRLTVNITPVNDAPVTFNRVVTVTEADEFASPSGAATGAIAQRNLLPADFLGGTAENPERSEASNFTDDVSFDASPGGIEYDEEEQQLRVVQFTVIDRSGVAQVINASRSGEVILIATGEIEFTFDDPANPTAFTRGAYRPLVDYNERTPFLENEQITYVIEDFDVTRIPGSDFINGVIPPNFDELDYTSTNNRSTAAMMTLRTRAFNDVPVVVSQDVIEILERDDNGATVISDFASLVAPGPATALDELQRETVVFTFARYESSTVANLFQRDPEISTGVSAGVTTGGVLTLFPAPDQVGSAVVVMLATDRNPTQPGFVPRSVEVTFTVNVRPVNDPPRFNPDAATAGPISSGDPDDVYQVTSDGVYTLTLREDNTNDDGTTGTPYIIPVRAATPGGRPGLLDLFTPGPANEADGTLGGSQTLVLSGFSQTTDLGGSVTGMVDGTGQIVSLAYTPPVNRNSNLVAFDTLNYTVRDNGSTWRLGIPGLESDPRTTTGRIRFVLNPVNDRPEFTTRRPEVVVNEDAGAFTEGSFVANVFAGPRPNLSNPATFATDEINNQSIDRFEIRLVSVTSPDNPTVTIPLTPELYAAAFDQPLAIDVASGQLSFRPAANVYGIFRFEVVAIDNGATLAPGNRGDLNESLPRALTVRVNPVNDAPVVVGTDTLSVTTAEDTDTLVLNVNGPGSMLENFRPGPAAPATGLPDEIDTDVLSVVGVPLVTAAGAELRPITVSGSIVGYRYVPALNFVGIDTFTYQVSDGDPARQTTATVSIDVTPLNDAPRVTLTSSNVSLGEDPESPVTIEDFLASVFAGPPGIDGFGRAVDEIDGITGIPAQSIIGYRFEFVSGDAGLIETSAANPTGLSIVNGTDLMFSPVAEASGSAIYTLVAIDDGLSDASNFNESVPVQFVISIDSLNDPPTFTPGPTPVMVVEDFIADVPRLDDDGNPVLDGDGNPIIDQVPRFYDEPWATDISPGPANESTQTVSFVVSFANPADAAKFDLPPSIDGVTGNLSFTLAQDADGIVQLVVQAVDSEIGLGDPFTLTIDIMGVDDPPRPTNDSFVSNEDVTLRFTVNDLLANDSDPDGDDLIFVELVNTTLLGATVTINEAGEISYNPRTSPALQSLQDFSMYDPNDPSMSLSDFQAVDTFVYGVTDESGETVIPRGVVTLTINGINDAPTVRNNSIPISDSGLTIVDLLADPTFVFDVDGTIDPATFIITREPQFGDLSDDNNDGIFTYLPGPNFTGEDSFAFTVADNLGQASTEAVFTLFGRPVADGVPRGGTSIDRPGLIDVTDSFISPFDLDLSTLEIITDPQSGTAEVIELADGRFVIEYTPDAGYLGEDFLIFRVADVNGNYSDDTRLNLNTVRSRLQNPVDPFDVNRNGFVTALDALLIINRLNAGSFSGELTGSGDIPVPDDAFGIGTNNGVDEQFYYDQSGDRRISALDALRVINELNRRASLPQGPSGEFVPDSIDATIDVLAAPRQSEEAVLVSDTLVAAPATANSLSTKVVIASSIEQTVARLAINQVRDLTPGEESTASNVDDVISQLF